MAAQALRYPVEVLTRGHAAHVGTSAAGIWTLVAVSVALVLAVSLGLDVASRIRPRTRQVATTLR